MSQLVHINNFERADNGVYQVPDADTFAYTDGESSEKFLEKILLDAQDLSSSSKELQAHILDWPSEYHLSSARSNLLRPLNLKKVKKVLELGCGCGSITRYLAEQPGIQVDSVEGSPSRAALAALRCRDLNNVTISTANFNHISIPEDFYDLVLFVGVTEYAGRFSERESDQEALQDLLSLGKKACKASGVTVIAIENRVGLKYLMGACEDHYGVPDVGLDGYPKSTGIRTYTKSEWQDQLDIAGFRHCQFAYPFPDYKVPSLLIKQEAIDEQVLKDHPHKYDVLAALSRVKSRCYLADFDLGKQEAKIWQGYLEAQTLDQHANSFLIFAGDDELAIKRISDFSLQEYQVTTASYRVDASHTSTSVITETDSQTSVFDQQKELDAVSMRVNYLEEKLKLITGSIGWRVLNVVRRLFGKPFVD